MKTFFAFMLLAIFSLAFSPPGFSSPTVPNPEIGYCFDVAVTVPASVAVQICNIEIITPFVQGEKIHYQNVSLQCNSMYAEAPQPAPLFEINSFSWNYNSKLSSCNNTCFYKARDGLTTAAA